MDWTQVEASRQLYVTPRAIQKYEAADCKPSKRVRALMGRLATGKNELWPE